MDKQRLAQVMRSLGKIKSDKKSAAARENGKKGGRPRALPIRTRQIPGGGIEVVMARRKINRSGCWVYTGSTNNKGYGQVTIDGGCYLVHRVAFTHFRGEIDEGMVLDHLCRNPLCFNPDHLEVVTHAVNMQRGANTKITRALADSIRAEYAAGGKSMDEIGARHGITRQNVSLIVRGETWA